jgi:hypothetical protein
MAEEITCIWPDGEEETFEVETVTPTISLPGYASKAMFVGEDTVLTFRDEHGHLRHANPTVIEWHTFKHMGGNRYKYVGVEERKHHARIGDL